MGRGRSGESGLALAPWRRGGGGGGTHRTGAVPLGRLHRTSRVRLSGGIRKKQKTLFAKSFFLDFALMKGARAPKRREVLPRSRGSKTRFAPDLGCGSPVGNGSLPEVLSPLTPGNPPEGRLQSLPAASQTCGSRPLALSTRGQKTGERAAWRPLPRFRDPEVALSLYPSPSTAPPPGQNTSSLLRPPGDW